MKESLARAGDGALLRDEEHSGTGSESDTTVSGMKFSAWLRDSC